MVQDLSEIHTNYKLDNIFIISLDVSNQEDDEEEKDFPQ